MKQSKDMLSQLTNGILTEKMDIGTKEYEDFRLLIRSKVAETPKEERIRIALIGLKFQIEDYLQSDKEIIPIGNFVKKFINLLEIKQVDFARYLEIRPSNLSKILNGERRVTTDMAVILEKLSKIDAELWLRIQSKNEIRQVEKSYSDGDKEYNLMELIS